MNNSSYDIIEEVNKTKEDILNVLNILQVFQMSLQQNQDDLHIVRTVRVIEQMIQDINENDIAKLMELSIKLSSDQ